MGVSCYDLYECNTSQMTLFDIADTRARRAADAMDGINDKYGEFTIVPGIMLEMDDLILDRIAFGGAREIEDLYAGGFR